MWEQDRMKFVHSTKEISVIDLYQLPRHGELKYGKAIRSLIFNARPNLIQSSIEVEYRGDESSKVLWGKPPPLVGLTATHLGGLALSVPLWLACRNNRNQKIQDDKSKPRALVLGAGGCTIPSVLKSSGCNVIAIEPSHDVRHAALRYFGAGTADADIELLPGYGEEYLKRKLDKVDILIIDAEDGQSAPPQSMKKGSFWREAVVPSLNADAVVAVNVIANPDTERMEFKHLVAEAMPSHDVWCCEVPSVAEVSNRHCILFATPSSSVEGKNDGNIMPRVKETMDEFDYVDMKSEWIEEMELARRNISC